MVNEGPYTHQASDSAYQFTKAAIEKGHEIFRVFFYHDGVNNGTYLIGRQRDYRQGVALEIDEFDLIALAIMRQDDGAYIAALQAVLGHVYRQDDWIEFHGHASVLPVGEVDDRHPLAAALILSALSGGGDVELLAVFGDPLCL